MTIAVELEYHGPHATIEEYKELRADAGITPGGDHPDPDCLFHWITEIPGGVRVTDVWTSREKWNAFEAGGSPGRLGNPQKKFYDGENILT
jgi:hypothetical protein